MALIGERDCVPLTHGHARPSAKKALGTDDPAVHKVGVRRGPSGRPPGQRRNTHDEEAEQEHAQRGVKQTGGYAPPAPLGFAVRCGLRYDAVEGGAPGGDTGRYADRPDQEGNRDGDRRHEVDVLDLLRLVGDRWTLVIMRDLVNGKVRYKDFLDSPERIASNILAARLTGMERAGFIESRLYQYRPKRYQYRLTPKGAALLPVLQAMCRWGETHIIRGAGRRRRPSLSKNRKILSRNNPQQSPGQSSGTASPALWRRQSGTPAFKPRTVVRPRGDDPR